MQIVDSVLMSSARKPSSSESSFSSKSGVSEAFYFALLTEWIVVDALQSVEIGRRLTLYSVYFTTYIVYLLQYFIIYHNVSRICIKKCTKQYVSQKIVRENFSFYTEWSILFLYILKGSYDKINMSMKKSHGRHTLDCSFYFSWCLNVHVMIASVIFSDWMLANKMSKFIATIFIKPYLTLFYNIHILFLSQESVKVYMY